MAEGSTAGKATVLVSLITVIGGISTALITNWEKIFPPEHKANVPQLVAPANATEPHANSSTTREIALQPKYPFTSQRAVNEIDLQNLSREECQLMRNEIYARKGYVFGTPAIQQYFQQQPWYKPANNNAAVVESLTDLEVANVSYIKSVEHTK